MRIIYSVSIMLLSMAFLSQGQMSAAEEVPSVNNRASLFSDVKAYRVGDVLSVVISERNTGSKAAQTNSQKQNSSEVSGEATTGALGGLFPGMGGSLQTDSQANGQATTRRSASLDSRMTVMVTDVLPNGNLLIEGNKTMEINEEYEVVTLSGIVQPKEISSSNTIYSYQVANAKITYKGKGAVSQGSRIGILGRIINFIF